jgi:hypothetical protein
MMMMMMMVMVISRHDENDDTPWNGRHEMVNRLLLLPFGGLAWSPAVALHPAPRRTAEACLEKAELLLLPVVATYFVGVNPVDSCIMANACLALAALTLRQQRHRHSLALTSLLLASSSRRVSEASNIARRLLTQLCHQSACFVPRPQRPLSVATGKQDDKTMAHIPLVARPMLPRMDMSLLMNWLCSGEWDDVLLPQKSMAVYLFSILSADPRLTALTPSSRVASWQMDGYFF